MFLQITFKRLLQRIKKNSSLINELEFPFDHEILLRDDGWVKAQNEEMEAHMKEWVESKINYEKIAAELSEQINEPRIIH